MDECRQLGSSLDLVLTMFQSDYDMIDYLNDLREGCLEAYTGIIQGMKGKSKDRFFCPLTITCGLELLIKLVFKLIMMPYPMELLKLCPRARVQEIS